LENENDDSLLNIPTKLGLLFSYSSKYVINRLNNHYIINKDYEIYRRDDNNYNILFPSQGNNCRSEKENNHIYSVVEKNVCPNLKKGIISSVCKKVIYSDEEESKKGNNITSSAINKQEKKLKEVDDNKSVSENCTSLEINDKSVSASNDESLSPSLSSVNLNDKFFAPSNSKTYSCLFPMISSNSNTTYYNRNDKVKDFSNNSFHSLSSDPFYSSSTYINSPLSPFNHSFLNNFNTFRTSDKSPNSTNISAMNTRLMSYSHSPYIPYNTTINNNSMHSTFSPLPSFSPFFAVSCLPFISPPYSSYSLNLPLPYQNHFNNSYYNIINNLDLPVPNYSKLSNSNLRSHALPSQYYNCNNLNNIYRNHSRCNYYSSSNTNNNKNENYFNKFIYWPNKKNKKKM
jgi:hypothetical protein